MSGHAILAVAGRRALTIVEVVVVLAVLAMLFALLLPAVQSAREAARRTQCIHRMRQIGVGLTEHCNVHDGVLPRLYPVGTRQRAWIDALAPFLEASKPIRVCTSDAKAPAFLRDGGTSYALNGYLATIENLVAAGCASCHDDSGALAASVPAQVVDLDHIASLSKTISFVEGRTGMEHVDSFHWFMFGSGEQAFKNVAADLAVDRHGGSANFLFLDGHVKTVASAEVREWCDLGDFMRPIRR
ncbi:MAG: DUF1559 domain-containing protein [Planctomycetota bacterium]